MAKTKRLVCAMNRGVVSPLAFGRVDLERIALSAEEQHNWIPRSLGPMSLRPGLQYLATSQDGGELRPWIIPFIFSTSDTAILEVTKDALRPMVNGIPPSIAANSTVMDDLDVPASWTDNDDTAATSSSFSSGLYMWGNGVNFAARTQQVLVAAEDRGERHAILLDVEYGTIELLVGPTAGGEDGDYLTVSGLKPGHHWLSFATLAAEDDFHVTIRHSGVAPALVTSCQLVTGDVLVRHPWDTEAKIASMRWEESADVHFVAAQGVRPHRIERRSDDSWSVVEYAPRDGPWNSWNTSASPGSGPAGPASGGAWGPGGGWGPGGVAGGGGGVIP